MRMSVLIRSTCVCALLALAPALMSQQWEIGVLGGGSFYANNRVQGTLGSGDVGFQPGFSAGGWLGHNSSGRIGGEIRYLFQGNVMKVSSSGATYTYGGRNHSVVYDLLIHTRPREDAVRPFVAVGGGMKGYFGTGKEISIQPLGNVAILTHTRQWQPLLSVGGGVKWALGARTLVRIEVRDLITPFPTDVILPAPGNKVSGWVHCITPLIGISYVY